MPNGCARMAPIRRRNELRLSRSVTCASCTAHHPMMWKMQERSKEKRFEMEEMMMFSHHMLERIVVRTEKANPALNAEAGDKAARAG